MKRLRLIPLALALSLLFTSVAAAAPSRADGGYWYSVRAGDTLFSIGRSAGVNPWTLAQVNGLANPNRIYAGQWLWIPVSTPPPPPRCGYYQTVYPGQTLFSIGRATGISPWIIASANGLYNPNLIYAGQSLWIPCS